MDTESGPRSMEWIKDDELRDPKERSPNEGVSISTPPCRPPPPPPQPQDESRNPHPSLLEDTQITRGGDGGGARSEAWASFHGG